MPIILYSCCRKHCTIVANLTALHLAKITALLFADNIKSAYADFFLNFFLENLAPLVGSLFRAVTYIENNWDELHTYRTDGKYDIDNLEAERSIRPWTVSRKNIGAFGSEQGVKDAAVYSTFIETCKRCDVCPQDYLTKVFSELRDGNTNYESLLPFNIALN